MTVPEAVVAWCLQQGHGDITGLETVGGGCINDGVRLHARDGASFFLKTNASAPPEMFAAEAHGLEALRRPGGPRLPAPHVWAEDFLLMEDLPPDSAGVDFWPTLGRRLAALHDFTSPRHGFDQDNFIGSTHQSNPWTEDGFSFFSEERLGFQARLAHRRRRLPEEDLGRIEALASRLRDLVPSQPASLIHGDLWSGNVIVGPGGEACLIDPAAYYGWAEAELGMTDLFGGFDPAFYAGYLEARPLPPGWRSRFPIYNLYHLLNHLNLFGEGYLSSIRQVLDRFG